MKRIGILCAGDADLAPYLTKTEKQPIAEAAMLKFYRGRIKGKEIIAVSSGVCKVNAAIAAQLLIDRFHADCIINSGTAGGMNKTVRIFDTIIARRTVYHDVARDILTDFHPYLPSVRGGKMPPAGKNASVVRDECYRGNVCDKRNPA